LKTMKEHVGQGIELARLHKGLTPRQHYPLNVRVTR
jgi:hypothetical protein